MRKKQFFLETTFAIDLEERESRDLYHRPFFFDLRGEWEDDLLVEGSTVYDAKGSGTYLSRRARAKLPAGMSWVPLSEVGSHMVTMSSLKPFRDPDTIFLKQDDVRILSVDGTIPFFGVDVITPKREPVFPDVPCTETVEYVPSDIDGRVTVKDGRYYNPKYRSDRGVVWQATGSFMPAPYGRMNVHHLPTYYNKTEKHINVSGLQPGYYCVARDLASLAAAIPNMARYFSKQWHGRINWSYLSISSEDGGYSSVNEVYNGIVTFMRFRSSKRPTPVSTAEISRTLDISASQTIFYCARSPEIFSWDPGNIKGTWILRENLTMLAHNGMTYLEVLEALSRDEEVPFRTSPGLCHQFLRNNGVRCFLRKDNGMIYLHS